MSCQSVAQQHLGDAWKGARSSLGPKRSEGAPSMAAFGTAADLGSTKQRWGEFDADKAAEEALRTVLGASATHPTGYFSDHTLSYSK